MEAELAVSSMHASKESGQRTARALSFVVPKLGTEGTWLTFWLILAFRLYVTPLPTSEAFLASLFYFIVKVPAQCLPGISDVAYRFQARGHGRDRGAH